MCVCVMHVWVCVGVSVQVTANSVHRRVPAEHACLGVRVRVSTGDCKLSVHSRVPGGVLVWVRLRVCATQARLQTHLWVCKTAARRTEGGHHLSVYTSHTQLATIKAKVCQLPVC